MPAPQQRTFTLRVNVEADPIAGDLADEGGGAHEFVGWLGLARALEALLALESARAWGSEDEKSGGPHS
jgi:hypothetical protein